MQNTKTLQRGCTGAIPQAAALRTIGEGILLLAAALEHTPTGHDDGALLPHTGWEPAPANETAGQRSARLRRWSERARRGEIPGAVRRNRVWWAPRAAIVAWVGVSADPKDAAKNRQSEPVEREDAMVISMRDAARRRAGRRGR